MRTRLWMLKLVLLGAASLALLAGAALAFLALPAADGWRRAAAERALTHFWGTPVEVRGKVDVALWPRLQLNLNDLASFSASGEAASASRLDITLATGLGLFRDGPVRRIAVSGAEVELPLRGVSDALPNSLLASPIHLLSVLPRLTMEDVAVVFADRARGWHFALHVDRLAGRPSGGRETMTAAGTFNAHPVTLGFAFDREPGMAGSPLPYGAEVSFEGPGLQFTFDIRAPDARFDHGLRLELSAQTSSVAGLLRLAGIAPVGDGSGTLKAMLTADPGSLAMETAQLDLTLSDDIQLRVSGQVQDLIRRTGIDLQAVADIHKEAPPAVSLRDIAMTRVSGQITDGRRGLLIKQMLIDTNAFSETLREIGPISIASVTRDDQGKVALRGISVQAGPEDQPVFHMTGDVLDILDLAGVNLAGTVDMPVDNVLELPDGAAGKLGRIMGQMAISDADGILGIDSLSARIEDSVLLSARLELSLNRQEGRAGVGDSELDTSISVPDFGALAGAFGVSTDFSGPAGFEGQVGGNEGQLEAQGRLVIGRTEIDGHLTGRLTGERSFIGGEISSKLVYGDELVAFLRQRQEGGPIKLSVVGAAPPPGGSRLDIVDSTDFDIKVLAARIDGAGSDASGIDARLRLDKGVFRADPVRVTYRGGRINAVVVSEGLPRLRATGSGEGWPLASFFPNPATAAATGTVRLAFNVTANIQAGQDPLRTLGGTLTANLSGGRLRTGMLDLAGVGLLGGLFTPSVWQGNSPLRCVRIPLTFTNGVGRTNPVILLETDRVRAVGRGTIDLARGTLDLFISPAPLSGRSLLGGLTGSQNFTVKGQLGAPRIALAAGKAITGNYRCN